VGKGLPGQGQEEAAIQARWIDILIQHTSLAMKTVEFEKTFLLRYVPGLKGCNSVEISDIYIPESSVHPVVRIRKIGDRMELTKKQPVDGKDSSEQSEHTIILSKEEYDSLRKIPGKELLKRRYFLGAAQIDVFHGKLEGLVMADFEFRSRQEMGAFRPPVFCLADVTQKKAFAGGMLCGKSYRDMEPELKAFGYKKISLTPR
jgi:CYTH domain-containing protein